MDKVNLVRQYLKTVQDRHKKLADIRCRELESQVRGPIFLKILPMRSVVHFGNWRKRSPMYIRLFKILKHMGKVSYRLVLPTSLVGVHNMFHVLYLKRYLRNETYIFDYLQLEIKPNLSYSDQPIATIGQMEKTLKKRVYREGIEE